MLHNKLVIFNATISPSEATIESVGARGLVGRCPEPDFRPAGFVEPLLGGFNQLCTDALAFVVWQDGDDPEFAVGSVGHAETDDLTALLADPASVRGGQSLDYGFFVNSNFVQALEGPMVLCCLCAEPDAMGDVGGLHEADG